MKQEARKNVGIRENYIGQSLKTEDSWIFGQGKKNEASDPQQELLEIKRREAELLHASLNGGIKVGVQKKLTQFEMEELLKKGQIERDEKDNAPMAGLGKRKGGGGGGVGFEAVQSTVLEGTVVDVKREPELPKGSVLEKGSKKEKKKEKKKDKKKEKKKVTRKTKIILCSLTKKKKKNSSKDKKKQSKKSRSRSKSREKRRHDSPEPSSSRRRSRSRSRGRRSRSRSRGRRHDSPVERRRRHDSSEDRGRREEKKRRHDTPEKTAPSERRQRHDSE